MEIEIEMTSKSTDMSKVLQKVTNVVNFAREQGFVIKELEIEEDDEEEDEEEDEKNKKNDEEEDD
jgi:hypothetical protein